MARVAFIMDRPLRKLGLSGAQLCADAESLRLLGSGHHGYPHCPVSVTCANDFTYPVYRLLQPRHITA